MISKFFPEFEKKNNFLSFCNFFDFEIPSKIRKTIFRRISKNFFSIFLHRFLILIIFKNMTPETLMITQL